MLSSFPFIVTAILCALFIVPRGTAQSAPALHVTPTVIDVYAEPVPFDELKGSVTTFTRDDLAAFKRPRCVVFVDALPLNPSGKVLKRELVASAPRPPG